MIYPRYGRADYLTGAERDFVRASYAALVTAVDRWTGRLLEKLDVVGLARNTAVIFLSDHGHLFGDHDLQGKPSGPLGKLYEVTTRVPAADPTPRTFRVRGSTASSSTPTLTPTVLELFGLEAPREMHGSSLFGQGREFAVSGRHSPLAAGREPDSEAARFDGTAGLATHGEPLTITDANGFYIPPAAWARSARG